MQALLIVVSSCYYKSDNKLSIFHAGSLSVPFYHITEEYKKASNNHVDIFIEQSGSLAAARKITDLNKTCDILALADYIIIDNMMIPQYADWSYIFAANEMVIAYNDKSRYSDMLNQNYWYEILLKDNVYIGRSEPNLDPCGYRTLFMFKLSEKYYELKGLYDEFISKDETVIRPKEVDLVAMLETGNIDYLFIYKSVAVQHKLDYLSLPDEINLGNPEYDSLYNTVSTIVDGAVKGEKLKIKASSILYGFTIPKNHRNYEEALSFVKFLVNPNKGGRILTEHGMVPLNIVSENFYNIIPKELREYVTSTTYPDSF